MVETFYFPLIVVLMIDAYKFGINLRARNSCLCLSVIVANVYFYHKGWTEWLAPSLVIALGLEVEWFVFIVQHMP